MDWNKVKQLYQASLDKKPAERKAFLDAMCAGDDELRREIETLSAEEDQAEHFLKSQSFEVLTAQPGNRKSLVGSTLGHHKVFSLLGAGGMGEVYLSHDTRLDRKVALKILSPEFTADQDRMKRFIREAKAASALNHPNVATIYDIGESEGVRFIAMEYVEGQTLSQKIGGRALTPAETVEIGKQVADALDAAHVKGITHRDIKPSNLMITPRGQVKVLDFGVAKITYAQEAAASTAVTDSSGTLPGIVMGTPAYMSPEQISGLKVDHRCDIFSLGIVLYEMTTGRSPFGGTSIADTLGQILHKQPDPISRLNAKAPEELGRIIRKCLEKDRDHRYQSARELFVDLKTLQRDSGSIAAGHPGTLPLLKRKLAWAVIGIAMVVLVIVGLAWLRGNQTTIDVPLDSLVVLPFMNRTTNDESEALCDGVTDSLINSLSQVRTLSVIQRTTSRSYKGKPTDPRQIGRELNVRAVVLGECSPRGDSLNIQVDLVDVASNTTLWADHYPAKLGDIFSVQDSIAAQIADKLRLRLSGEEQQRVTKHHTRDPEAYQLYVLGRHYANKFTKEGFEKALAMFDQAIARDPDYAMAYAGKAEAYMIASDLFVPSIEAGQKAQELAGMAVARDNQLSEAHCALAVVLAWYSWDWRTAEREYKLARDLDPASGCINDSYAYGTTLAYMGRLDEAVPELERALRLDPRSALRHTNLGVALYYAHRYDDAIKEFHKAGELDPKYWFAPLGLGVLYAQIGKYDEALAEFQKLPPDEFRDADVFIAFALAKAGRKSEALEKLEQLQKKVSQTAKSTARTPSPWGLATLYTALGNVDEAFNWFNKARDERFITIAQIRLDPTYDSLRMDPRYEKLIRDIGLEP